MKLVKIGKHTITVTPKTRRYTDRSQMSEQDSFLYAALGNLGGMLVIVLLAVFLLLIVLAITGS